LGGTPKPPDFSLLPEAFHDLVHEWFRKARNDGSLFRLDEDFDGYA
jgi:hypothetical protein